MKTYHQLISKFKNQRGATAIIVAIALVMLIGFVALAVDIGYLSATKNELQNISDSAALAAAGKLGDLYVNDQVINDTNADIIRNVAVDIGSKNRAADKSGIVIDHTNIEIGKWDQDADPKFVANASDPFIPIGDEVAVKVTACRDGSANGPISTFFAKIFGIQTVDVRADAIAALTGAGEIPDVQLPIGVSSKWFDKTGCIQHIDFNDTKDSCAGWHNFNLPISGSSLADKLLGMITGHGCPGDDCNVGPTDKEPDGDIDENDTDLSEGEAWWLETPVFPATIPPDHFEDYSGYDLPDRDPPDGADLGDEFEYTGGAVADMFTSSGPNAPAPMQALFDYYRTHDDDEDPINPTQFNPEEFTQPDDSIGIDTTLPPDGTADITDPDLVWSTYVPVYYEDPSAECTNPNTSLPVAGFARIYVLGVYGPPANTIDVRLPTCSWTVVEERGEGGIGSVLGYIPNLVE